MVTAHVQTLNVCARIHSLAQIALSKPAQMIALDVVNVLMVYANVLKDTVV